MLKRVVMWMCVVGLLCSVVAAGEKGKHKGKGKGAAKGGIPAILNTLDLTDEQKPKVDEAMTSYREKLKAASSKEEKKEARQAFNAELENILTPEQLEKFREETKKRHGGKGKKKAEAEE